MRHSEIDHDPSYGVDEDGWVGYYFRADEADASELLAMGKRHSNQ